VRLVAVYMCQAEGAAEVQGCTMGNVARRAGRQFTRRSLMERHHCIQPNRRVRANSNTATTPFLWGGNKDWQCLEERDTSGDLVARYTYAPGYIDDVVVQERDLNDDDDFGDSNEVVYYHQNTLFSVYALTDASETVAERYRYDAYGSCTVLEANGAPDADGISDIENPWAFTGRRFDLESGLVQFRARYYSALLGRFLARDPAATADNSDFYSYVGGRPTVLSDPAGLKGHQPTATLSIVLPPKGNLQYPQRCIGTSLGRFSVPDYAFGSIIQHVTVSYNYKYCEPDIYGKKHHYKGSYEYWELWWVLFGDIEPSPLHEFSVQVGCSPCSHGWKKYTAEYVFVPDYEPIDPSRLSGEQWVQGTVPDAGSLWSRWRRPSIWDEVRRGTKSRYLELSWDLCKSNIRKWKCDARGTH
jgi:RHS repeat-associated protein